jgi:hypothetical protein
MELNHIITGQAPPDSRINYTPTSKTNSDLIEQWYLDPLRRMKSHEAFVCLSICFVLYEKLLRYQGEMADDEKFSEGRAVFNKIGSNLHVSKEVAYEIWSHWRNGLLHKAMPATNSKFKFALDRLDRFKNIIVLVQANRHPSDISDTLRQAELKAPKFFHCLLVLSSYHNRPDFLPNFRQSKQRVI